MIFAFLRPIDATRGDRRAGTADRRGSDPTPASRGPTSCAARGRCSRSLQMTDRELSILLTGDDQMQKLNRDLSEEESPDRRPGVLAARGGARRPCGPSARGRRGQHPDGATAGRRRGSATSSRSSRCFSPMAFCTCSVGTTNDVPRRTGACAPKRTACAPPQTAPRRAPRVRRRCQRSDCHSRQWRFDRAKGLAHGPCNGHRRFPLSSAETSARRGRVGAAGRHG